LIKNVVPDDILPASAIRLDAVRMIGGISHAESHIRILNSDVLRAPDSEPIRESTHQHAARNIVIFTDRKTRVIACAPVLRTNGGIFDGETPAATVVPVNDSANDL
jgi:hypothetical protein